MVSIRIRWRAATASIPAPVHLPFGAWFLARNDNVGEAIRGGSFETAEATFVSTYLRPGMTVLDVGANQGYYTLLASRRVGNTGRVIAFEPSPREKKSLRIHKRLNGCRNVNIAEVALGADEKQADLFVVQGYQTGCNSLRPPIVFSEIARVKVQIVRLDDWMEAHKIERVDFIKLDVEGGELEVFKGADKLLGRKPRPVILVEVQDLRTEPWGYRAKEIIGYLMSREYKWFRITSDGSLEQLDVSAETFDGNFVAIPEERRE